LAILHGLVFELRQGLDDLQFRLELLDGKTSVLLQILSTFQGAFHFTLDADAVGAAEHTHAGDSSERGLPAGGGDSGQAMHVAMDEDYMPTEEETPGEYVAAGMGLHAPREVGGTWPNDRREGVTRTPTRMRKWNGEGQLLKRSPGTKQSMPPLRLDGQVTNPVYDQYEGFTYGF
jgi:hypothetical protein